MQKIDRRIIDIAVGIVTLRQVDIDRPVRTQGVAVKCEILNGAFSECESETGYIDTN
jgi:hypothetical protein